MVWLYLLADFFFSKSFLNQTDILAQSGVMDGCQLTKSGERQRRPDTGS